MAFAIAGCDKKDEAAPPPRASASAKPAPSLPKATPEEAAETPVPKLEPIGPDASMETKLDCPKGTVPWGGKGTKGADGIYCVTQATAKAADPVREGPSLTFHKNGARHLEGRWEAGKRSGHWITWSDRGTKESESDWVAGQRDGLYVAYWANGKRSAEAHYRGDKMNGESKTWDDRGKLMAISQYADDKLVSQKEYAPEY
jgi:hypothetical protein